MNSGCTDRLLHVHFWLDYLFAIMFVGIYIVLAHRFAWCTWIMVGLVCLCGHRAAKGLHWLLMIVERSLMGAHRQGHDLR